jgi:hypothetical protein
MAGLLVALQPGTAAAAPNLWSITPSPNVAGAHSSLVSVSCLSVSDCVAVGAAYTPGTAGQGDQTLIESWNGTTWSIVSSPNEGDNNDQLNQVSCVSSTYCVAVGNYSLGGGPVDALIESWDGTSWTIVASPDPGSYYNFLDGVSCSSATSCVAVGYDSNASENETLIESWDGVAWSTVSSPNVDSFSALTGVSCLSATSCVAVGGYIAGIYSNGPADTLVESWDGDAWTIVSSPDPGSDDNLMAVTCTSDTDCVATGAQGETDDTILVESWDGSSWTTVPSPNPGSYDVLRDVSCTGPADCVGVGSSNSENLVEAWNGTVWSVTPSPNAYTGNNTSDGLSGVSCTGPDSCTAVGGSFNGSDVYNTLALTGSLAPPPTITVLKPKHGPVKRKVSIYGTNLQFATAVTFNGKTAVIKANTATRIIARVPAGATTGPIQVTTAGGTATSRTSFIVTARR